MKKLIWVLFLALFLHSAYAVKVKSYEAEVLVLSQNEQLREEAIQQAFIQTLIKMSGSLYLLKNPVIKAALPGANNEVLEFGYRASGIAARPYLLQVQFDPKALKKLLRQAKEPIWDENRPLLLVWLSIDKAGHSSEVIDNQSNNEFALLLKNEAQQRGLPILLPIMDLAELNQVSAADIRAKSLLPLQKAATRYHADGLLIGSIEASGKMLLGQWKLILGQDHWDWSLSSETAPEQMSLLANKMVSILAGRYASVQTEQVSSSFTLVVKGVIEQDDFDHLMRFIKHISLIKELEIENIMEDKVVMHLSVQGAQKAFMQDASVGQHLQLQAEGDHELTYLWLR